MGAAMTSDDSDTPDLLSRAAAGDAEGLGGLFDRHRDRLRRMVQVRLDRRLQGDVVVAPDTDRVGLP
jgi:RNA polymerase sigma-70 factor (ECF subfamily)